VFLDIGRGETASGRQILSVFQWGFTIAIYLTLSTQKPDNGFTLSVGMSITFLAFLAKNVEFPTSFSFMKFGVFSVRKTSVITRRRAGKNFDERIFHPWRSLPFLAAAFFFGLTQTCPFVI